MIRESGPENPGNQSKKEWSPAYEKVICSTCKREYTCLPEDDYYNSTCNTDGVCESCLKKQHNIKKVIDERPGRPENN